MALIFNFDRLKTISMGDEEFAEELVRVFLDDAADQVEKLRMAVERFDCGAATQAAHRLKGAGGNVGAEMFAQVCHQLESAARKNVSSELAPAFQEVDRELARARSACELEMKLG